MKIGAVSQATGLTDRTIRYYIEEGLLQPEFTKNYTGRKSFDFTQEHVTLLHQISVLRKYGFSITDIKTILADPTQSGEITQELIEKKRQTIQTEQMLLDTLLQLDKQKDYTLPELAEALDSPVLADVKVPKEEIMKDVIKALVIFLVMTLPIIGLVYCFRDYKIVRTTDRIEDYGIITGNISNEEPYEHIFSFFPAQIEESFSDVSYHYASRKDDIWAYECYLEFVVEDSSEFESVLNKYVDPTLATVFKFDERYMECTLDNILYIRWDTLEGGSTGKGYPIEDACIGKILYDTQQQRMIFWAFGVFDGSGVGTNHLHYFFDRFQIDPFEYQLTAYYLYKDQLEGVTYEERFGANKPEIIFYRE